MLVLNARVIPTTVRACHSVSRAHIINQRHARCNRPNAAFVGIRAAGFFSRGIPVCQSSVSEATKDITTCGALEIQRIRCLSDNYAWLITTSSKTAIVDPSEPGPVLSALKSRGLQLDYILNTHHHWDHTGGNEDLKSKTGARVVAPKADSHRIPGIDEGLSGGDVWKFGDLEMTCIETPGHTSHSLCFWFQSENALFTGDTLFSMGCGRLFEGTPPQMFDSLAKIRKLPAETTIMPGHEYTQSNAKFAIGLEPSNAALQQRCKEVDQLRSQGEATVPTSLRVELETNPFLRSDQEEIKTSLGLPSSASPLELFTAVRAAKDKA